MTSEGLKTEHGDRALTDDLPRRVLVFVRPISTARPPAGRVGRQWWRTGDPSSSVIRHHRPTSSTFDDLAHCRCRDSLRILHASSSMSVGRPSRRRGLPFSKGGCWIRSTLGSSVSFLLELLLQRWRASAFITPFKVIKGHWCWVAGTSRKPVCGY